MNRRPSGIVLAAGAGSRMGGPKALLVVPSGPIAALHIEALRRAGCARPIIVTRPDCLAALTAILGDRAQIVPAETPDPAASLAVGVSAAPLGDPVIVTPVDAQPPDPATFTVLLGALDDAVVAATPHYEGRGGHPAVCRASVLDAYGALAKTPRPLRDVLHALGARRVRVPVDDAAVTVRLDTPEDVVAAYGVPPRFLTA